eukprot:492934-Prymnesium_polylepis.1
MGKSFGPQADHLSLHRDRHGASERNVGLAESGPIEVRIEAFTRVCAVDPHELDHRYHHQTPPDGGGGV